jgi:hypothetical protein
MGFKSGYNLPPGCFERDLPGYNDIDVDIDFICEETDDCGEWTESVSADPRGGYDVETHCPVCGEKVKQVYNGVDFD